MSDGARSECWTMLPYLRVDSVTISSYGLSSADVTKRGITT